MKKLLILIAFLIFSSISIDAKMITFNWNLHSQSAIITGFKIYKRNVKAVYNYNQPISYALIEGDEIEFESEIIGPYMFVARAYADSDDCASFSGCDPCPCYSVDSNEITNAMSMAVRTYFLRR